MGLWVLPSVGLEAGGAADGEAGGFGSGIGRDSAWVGNLGLAYRNDGGGFLLDTGGIYSGSAIAPFSAHGCCAVYQVRIFFRCRAFPSSEEYLLRFGSAVNSICGAISIDNTGLLRFWNVPGSDLALRQDFSTFSGTSPTLTVNTWYEIRLFTDWGESASFSPGSGWGGAQPAVAGGGANAFDGPGNYAGYQVGFDATTGSVPTGGFGVIGTYLTSVRIMAGGLSPTTPGSYDFDGLTILQSEAAPVVITGDGTEGYSFPNAITLLTGKPGPALVPATALLSAGAWTVVGGGTPDPRYLNDIGQSSVTSGALTSSTANDPLQIRYTPDPAVYGGTLQGIRVSLYCLSHGSAATGTITINGGTPITVSFTTGTWTTIWVREQVNAGVGTIDLTLTHPNDTAILTIQNLLVQRVAAITTPISMGDITVATGTYVGNGAVQSIDCGFTPSRTPDWVFLTRNDSGAKGILWWESMVNPQDWQKKLVRSAEFSPTAIGFDVTGAAAQTNANGITYRWFAIVDDSKRGLFRGAAASRTGVAATLGSPATSFNVPPATFTTAALWAHAEALTDASSLNGGYYRGPGHTGTNSSPLNSSEDGTGIRSLPGSTWDIGTGLAQSQPQLSYTAWSVSAFTSQPLWAVTSYTGDGNGSPRTITLALGGYKPGWVIVVPHDRAGYVRASTHAANTSQTLDTGSTSTTAIQSFVGNGVTVSTTLNTTGIVYDVMAIIDPSSTSGGGGGGGNGSITDAGPDTPCMVTFPMAPDSGGGAGCLPALPTGSDSAGGSGCGVSL